MNTKLELIAYLPVKCDACGKEYNSYQSWKHKCNTSIKEYRKNFKKRIRKKCK